MKAEFGANVPSLNNALLKCFQAYLWVRNELEALKKILLSEAYHEVIAKDGGHPDQIAALDPNTSLFKAILDGMRGSQDYPTGGLLLTQDEKKNVQTYLKMYITLYTDAYVTSA